MYLMFIWCAPFDYRRIYQLTGDSQTGVHVPLGPGSLASCQLYHNLSVRKRVQFQAKSFEMDK
jgi:hypothetical protein